MLRKSSIRRASELVLRDGMALTLLVKTVRWNGDGDLARDGFDKRGERENHSVTEPTDDADDEEKPEQAGHATTRGLLASEGSVEFPFPARMCSKSSA